ncbi:hypothetical protein [Nocardia spumae]|uniref:hypothetical protein n=1 Tax=Nocardia spumae TaxID=2887190 RepID=UPI001D13BAF6|nr:hypothetical protein [Nocardia spumae]
MTLELTLPSRVTLPGGPVDDVSAAPARHPAAMRPGFDEVPPGDIDRGIQRSAAVCPTS